MHARVFYRQGSPPVRHYPLDGLAEAASAVLQDEQVQGVDSGWDSFLQDHAEARVFFLNEFYAQFSDAWRLAQHVRGQSDMYPSVRRSLMRCATSFVSGVALFAPDADASRPAVRRGARRGAAPS